MVSASNILPFQKSDDAPLAHGDFTATRTVTADGIFDTVEEVQRGAAGATPLETHDTLRQSFTDYDTHGRLLNYLNKNGVHASLFQPYRHADRTYIILAVPKEQYAQAVKLIASPPSEERSYFADV